MSIKSEFCKNFKTKPKSTLRRIGLELEFPTVTSAGNAINYNVVRSLFAYLKKTSWTTHMDEGTNEVVSAEKNISESKGRFGYENDVISTDVGYCTIEVSLTPEIDLKTLENHWNLLKNIIVQFLNSHNSYLLGYGVQPLSLPSKKLIANKGRYIFFEQDSMNRFIDQKMGVDLHVFATSAANQCHIDIYKDEAIRAVNICNGLSPLITVLTANAPIWAGKLDTEWIDVREIFWDKSWSNRVNQTGIPDTFSSYNDYVNRLCEFRPLMVKRNGEYIKILDCRTFGEYLKKGSTNKGETVSGKFVDLKASTSDINFHAGFAWWNVRLSPSHGTIEFRVSGQQPQNAILSVPALALGIIENLDEAEKLYGKFNHNDWQKLRFDTLRHGFGAKINNISVIPLVKDLLAISEKGLKSRGLKEEVYLNEFIKRYKSRKNPADNAIEIYKKKGMDALVKELHIK